MRLLIFSFFTICAAQLQAQQKNIYYPSGFVQFSYQVKDGRLNGDFVSYYENGFVKAKVNFIQGQKQGIWKAWDTTGILRTERNYRDNYDFDIVAEWTKTGCGISADEVSNKNNKLHTSTSAMDDVIYRQRFWKKALPVASNSKLYDNEFRNLLIKGIGDGTIAAFSDDRFVNVIPVITATQLLNKTPIEFITKEDHIFSAGDQQMKYRMIGLGLSYKEQESEKTIWIYYPDLLTKLPGNEVVKGFQNNLFITEIDKTTAQSRENSSRKVQEIEKIFLLLGEADYEAQAWIYLLNKDIAIK